VPFPTLQELGGIMDLTLSAQAQAQAQAPVEPALKEPALKRTALGVDDLLEMRNAAKQVPVADSVRESALKLVLATHPETPDAPEIARKYLRFGASPRAAQAILSTARVRALEQGRFNVAYDDIRFVAPACLRHRLALNFAAVTEGREMESIVAQLVNEYVK
jgi:MoxR-like ATPase